MWNFPEIIIEHVKTQIYIGSFCSLNFYAPGLKGPPGASSNWIVRLSVRVSVCPFVRNSLPLTNKVQYLKVWGDDTVTKLGL